MAHMTVLAMCSPVEQAPWLPNRNISIIYPRRHDRSKISLHTLPVIHFTLLAKQIDLIDDNSHSIWATASRE